jgi:hypothetical protein
MTSTRRTLGAGATAVAWALAGVGGCWLMSPAAALAQSLGSGLSEDIARSGAISPDQKAQIARFIAEQAPGLSGDAAAIRRSRNALVGPLRVGSVSSAFRLEYSTQLLAVVRPLAGSERDEVALNAVRLAGELGTRSGMDVLDSALKDKRASVRVMAAMGYGRAFSTAREGSTPLIPAQTTPAVASIVSAMSGEQEAPVLEALLGALESAARVPEAQVPGLRALAMETLGVQSGELARRADEAHVPAVIAGARALVEQLNRSTERPAPGVIRGAGQAAGEAAALLLRRAGAAGAGGGADVDTEARTRLGLLGDQARSLYTVAAARAGAGQAVDVRLGDAVREGSEADLKRDAARLFDALSKPPFSLPVDRFRP